MFQIKDFASIAAAEINHARAVTKKITDFAPGSVARTLMEAPAVEIEELYMQMFLGLREAIPVATFKSFGFDKLPAAFAVGYVSVSTDTPLPQDLLIPAGTVFSSSDGRSYASTHDVTWLAGAIHIKIQVRCTTVGLAGNIAAGSITSSPFFDATYTVSNQLIETGRDVETDAEREVRFAEFIQSLSRGTVEACSYAAKQSVVLDADGNRLEYVTRIGLEESGGRVRIFLYSSTGAPSAGLLADGQARMDGTKSGENGTSTAGFRAAGIRVDVLPMTERDVSLSIKVEMLPGYALNAAVEQQLDDIFAASIRSVQPGATLYLGTLVDAMLASAGVKAIVPTSTENIICGVNEVLTPGVLGVSAL